MLTCETCKWWDKFKNADDFGIPENTGSCRVGRPSLTGDGFATLNVLHWPWTVGHVDWCGEHKQKDEVS